MLKEENWWMGICTITIVTLNAKHCLENYKIIVLEADRSAFMQSVFLHITTASNTQENHLSTASQNSLLFQKLINTYANFTLQADVKMDCCWYSDGWWEWLFLFAVTILEFCSEERIPFWSPCGSWPSRPLQFDIALKYTNVVFAACSSLDWGVC